LFLLKPTFHKRMLLLVLLYSSTMANLIMSSKDLSYCDVKLVVLRFVCLLFINAKH
jgi:hypothetical protein